MEIQNMEKKTDEVFEVRDYLIENDYPQGLIDILDDYFTNKSITLEEMQVMMEHDKFAELVDSYQLRGADYVK